MISIKGWQEFSMLDWPGKLASVIFLPGCNFRCPFCHNHVLVREPESLEDIPLPKIISGCKARPGWMDGIVVSGGEPTIHPELPALLDTIKSHGLGVKLDTNGSRPDVVREVILQGLVDHLAMDVKAPLEPELYARMAGVPIDPETLGESIDVILTSGLPHTFRTTVVPGLIGRAEIRRLAAALRGARRLVLQNFDPRDALDPSWRALTPLPEDELQAMSDEIDGLLGGGGPAGGLETAAGGGI